MKSASWQFVRYFKHLISGQIDLIRSTSNIKPGGVCGEFHAGECADCLVSEVERIEGRRVEDVGDNLVPHENVLQQVLERAL